MPDRKPLDDRLAGLREGPVPALAGPSVARARGHRLRRRQRITVACAALTTVAALGGAASLLTGSGSPDALRSANAPATGPTAEDCEDLLGVTPRAEWDVVVYGGAYTSVLECTFEQPEASVPERGTPESAGTVDWSADAGFLSPETAAAAEQPGWAVVEPYETGPDRLLDPCPDRDLRLSEGQVHASERAMASSREAGGSTLVQEVTRYVDQRGAEQAVQELADELVACPSQPNEYAEIRLELVERLPSPTAQTMLVRRLGCDPGGACTAHFATYFLVAQVGDGVTVAHYQRAEDGDRSDLARALLDAVAAELAVAVRG